ncbi:TonB-dependent receptor [Caldichromatium japonicum]|uniref:TonB-dependent receptor n=1 Tax=Caldichromatium japonicum TaxID=2699430 RepID=A0A6G7VDU2_9GAMM|nr:TonB-dependent receptor [Caldichromatium japonicum]QIK38055.1 TonB-dependent receptor [Caldichromatium japonicum]
MSKRPWPAALGLPLAGCFVFAWAEEPPTLLDPVVVTATRTAESAASSLAAVTVIDRAEIERRQARSVPDLLREVAGISIARAGGPGHQTSVFVRGTNSDHVLVLIDGVKVGSATTGRASLADLPIEAIEHIEIVRGPRSSLYGSEAIGGVIQIFTRRSEGPWRGRLMLGSGSFETAQIASGLGGESGPLRADLGFSLERTAGIDACRGRSAPFAGCGVEEDDRDPYRNLGLNLNADFKAHESAALAFNLLHNEGRLAFDGSAFSGNRSRAERTVAGAKATLTPFERWTLTLNTGYSLDEERIFYREGEDERFLDRFTTERFSAGLQNDWRLTPEQLLTLGVDYREDQVSGTIAYRRDVRDNLGVFGEYQLGRGPWMLNLSLRQDEDGELGGHGTGNVALGYRLANGLAVRLAHGTAFKAPSFNDLYYPDYGNPDLRPERARNWELGLQSGLPAAWGLAGGWEISLYQTHIHDLIAYDAAIDRTANVREAKIRGFETSAHAAFGDWLAKATLTLLDPENHSPGPYRDNLLPRRPEQSVSLDLDRRFGRYSAGISLFAAGRRYDDLANRVRLAPYVLLDLRAEYQIDRSLRFQASVENMFATNYETAYLYRQPGRALYLTLRYETP